MRLPHGWEIRSWISKKFFPERPVAASMKEWFFIHKKEKEAHPFLYWIDKDVMQFFSLQKMRLDDMKYWFMYRFIKAHKYHLVDTELGYGYHSNDRILMHANFKILKDFVEIEKAQHQYAWKDEPKDTPPIEAALKYIDWERSLVISEDEVDADDPRIGMPTSQATSANEIKELYLWWTVDRPARQDPYDAYPDDEKDDGTDWFERQAMRTEKEEIANHNRFKKIRVMEADYEEEDTDMLVRLVKIRKELWT